MSSMFVVQSFTAGKKGQMRPDAPILVNNKASARRSAERLSERKPLVIAFMREGDPMTGEFEDPKLIAAFGELPEELAEMERAN